MDYSLPEYIEFVRLGDERAVISGPLTRTELRGESVELVERSVPYLRDGVSVVELEAALDVPTETAEALIEGLAEVTDLTTHGDDMWDWASGTPDETRDSIGSANVGVIAAGVWDLSVFGDITTTIVETVDGLRAESEIFDALLTLSVGERPDFHGAVLEKIYEAELPWLPARLVDDEVVLGPLSIPHETACYNCYYQRHLSCDSRPSARMIELESRAETESYPSYTDSARQLLTATAETELLALLSGHVDPETKNAVVRFDVRRASRDRSVLYRVPGCDVCGKQ